MSGLVVLGLLWAAVGILLGIRWWSEREQAPGHHAAHDATAESGWARFGRGVESRSEDRLQVMRFAYACGTSLVAIGFLFQTAAPLAFGALFVNLGTIERYLVVLLDRDLAEEPALLRPERPAAHRRSRQPIVTRVLLGDLAK